MGVFYPRGVEPEAGRSEGDMAAGESFKYTTTTSVLLNNFSTVWLLLAVTSTAITVAFGELLFIKKEHKMQGNSELAN